MLKGDVAGGHPVMPAEVSNVLNPNPPNPAVAPDSLLNRLAERIARNREVLGVHYRSDSEAGRQLAQATFDVLRRCPSLNTANTGAFDMAHAEWPP
jgi:hypothetical protein